ncbi:hypothetical protein Q5P01_016581 [Channa striata]|uniref:Uncharacterized protein n=1 Tax=Channa striata TaxID=64152 RepID=A0AA88MBN8_CHASR|nr:hypothetical protein Q5P01_016581 [Channa striata]
MVFNILVKHRASDGDSLYAGLSDLMDGRNLSLYLSLGRTLPDIHRSSDYAKDPRSPDPVKVYDHALVHYLFSDSLELQAASGHRGETENGQGGRHVPLQAEPNSVSHDEPSPRSCSSDKYQNAPHTRRGYARPKKVSSVTVSLKAVYDMLALYAPDSHTGFWDQLGEAMVDLYKADDEPPGCSDTGHLREASRGPTGTFHGSRILLRTHEGAREPLTELEYDWEMLEASDVFNKVHGCDSFSPDTLKRDYAVTMMAV